jgi:hypothetical protein
MKIFTAISFICLSVNIAISIAAGNGSAACGWGAALVWFGAWLVGMPSPFASREVA